MYACLTEFLNCLKMTNHTLKLNPNPNPNPNPNSNPNPNPNFRPNPPLCMRFNLISNKFKLSEVNGGRKICFSILGRSKKIIKNSIEARCPLGH